MPQLSTFHSLYRSDANSPRESVETIQSRRRQCRRALKTQASNVRKVPSSANSQKKKHIRANLLSRRSSENLTHPFSTRLDSLGDFKRTTAAYKAMYIKLKKKKVSKVPNGFCFYSFKKTFFYPLVIDLGSFPSKVISLIYLYKLRWQLAGRQSPPPPQSCQVSRRR